MPAPNPLCKLLLRKARIAEDAVADSGETYLLSILETCATVTAAGGLQMTSASTAGKAFTFLNSLSIQSVQDAVDEALGIWAELTRAQIDQMLDTRPRRTTYARFGCQTRCY